jgi:hypothetical protein
MDFSGYMFELRNFDPKILGEVEKFFLEEIFKGKYNSAYKMYKYLELQPHYTIHPSGGKSFPLDQIELVARPIEHKMAYKNVHKRFKRLQELKLIEEIKGTFEKGAKYFTVTNHGIMYLDPDFFLNPKYSGRLEENIVWKTLILQFLEEETFESIIFAPQLKFEISNYLGGCINDTTEVFRNYRIQLNRYDIKLTDSESEYYFGRLTNPTYLNPERFEDRNKKIRKEIDDFEDRYYYDKEQNQSTVEFSPFYLRDKLRRNVKYLVFRLLCHHDLGKENIGIIRGMKYVSRDDTTRLLAKDKKFLSLARNIKDEFLHGCKTLII